MSDLRAMSANEPGLPTLVVGECPLGHVTVDTRLLSNRSDRDQCAFRPSEGESPERSVSAAVMRRFLSERKYLIN
jgi:hypothetical protein